MVELRSYSNFTVCLADEGMKPWLYELFSEVLLDDGDCHQTVLDRSKRILTKTITRYVGLQKCFIVCKNDKPIGAGMIDDSNFICTLTHINILSQYKKGIPTGLLCDYIFNVVFEDKVVHIKSEDITEFKNIVEVYNPGTKNANAVIQEDLYTVKQSAKDSLYELFNRN